MFICKWISLVLVILVTCGQETPCPKVFLYNYDDTLLYGHIKINLPERHNNTLHLQVHLSIGNNISEQESNNKLTFLGTAEDIENKNPLCYRLDFPTWDKIPPKVTLITLNDVTLCVGEPVKHAKVITTVTLTSKLTITRRYGNNPNSINSETMTNDNNVVQSQPPHNNNENSIVNKYPAERITYRPNTRYPTRYPSYNQFYPLNYEPSQFPNQNNPSVSYFGFQNNNNNVNSNFSPTVPTAKPTDAYNKPNQYYTTGNYYNYYTTKKPIQHQPAPSYPIPQNNHQPRPAPSYPSNQNNNNHQPSLPNHSVQDKNNPPPPTQDINNNDNICGRPQVATHLIAHGSDIEKGVHPWVGAIFRRQSSLPEFICGSSLITNKIAITAGHCVTRYINSEIIVIFGRININDWLDPDGQYARIKSIKMHPDYSNHTADADLALLHFMKPISFTNNVMPVCLWNTNSDIGLIRNQEGVVLGWGADENNVNSQKLQKVYAPVADQEQCLRLDSSFIKSSSNRTFCAGARNNAGPCSGDSGGGFYMFIENRWTIRGIVSHALLTSSGRCDLSKYIVYLDVAKHTDWIKQQINIISND